MLCVAQHVNRRAEELATSLEGMDANSTHGPSFSVDQEPGGICAALLRLLCCSSTCLGFGGFRSS